MFLLCKVNIFRESYYFVRVIYTTFGVWKSAIVSLTLYNVQDWHYTHELLDYMTNGICGCKAARLKPINQSANSRTISFPRILNTSYQPNKNNPYDLLKTLHISNAFLGHIADQTGQAVNESRLIKYKSKFNGRFRENVSRDFQTRLFQMSPHMEYATTVSTTVKMPRIKYSLHALSWLSFVGVGFVTANHATFWAHQSTHCDILAHRDASPRAMR